MNLHELLEQTGTLMQFSGQYGYGWYARGLGRVNKWGFGKTPEIAMTKAMEFPLEAENAAGGHVAVVVKGDTPRGRVRLNTAPPTTGRVRLRNGFFD